MHREMVEKMHKSVSIFLQKCFAKIRKHFCQKMKTLLPKNENTFAEKRKHFLGNREQETCPEEIF